MLYIDDIGIEVMGELHDQRATLIRTKDRVNKFLYKRKCWWLSYWWYRQKFPFVNIFDTTFDFGGAKINH